MSNGQTIERIQDLLRRFEISGWLFYDFRGSDPSSYRILKLDPEAHSTRRWFYLVPARGEPRKLVHRIESGQLDSLPGSSSIYLQWSQLRAGVEALTEGLDVVAMQYSPENSIPYVSYVDAGTVELVRSSGCQVVSSADLMQQMECVWSSRQLNLHRQAADKIGRIVHQAFEQTAHEISNQGQTTEFAIQQFILSRFQEESLITDFPAIVAVSSNSADPHYHPTARRHSSIQAGDFLLIDLWARESEPDSVFADITWTAQFSSDASSQIQEVFEVVRRARDRGVDFLRNRLEGGAPVYGWEVDEAVRSVIVKAGYKDAILHRTGHSLGQDMVHGNAVNFDNLETHDVRQVISGIGCTLEPGIYLEDFGVRSEINVFVQEGGVQVTTIKQEELLLFDV